MIVGFVSPYVVGGDVVVVWISQAGGGLYGCSYLQFWWASMKLKTHGVAG